MLILAIDPGLAGALCWMDGAGNALWVADLPILDEGRSKKYIDALELAGMIWANMPDAAVIEAVHARPTDSKTGAFTFGRNVGALEAVIMSLNIPLTRVSPITWRRYAGLAPGVGKDASISAAMRLHPTARPMLEGKQARHDRGDAVLIGGWFIAQRGR